MNLEALCSAISDEAFTQEHSGQHIRYVVVARQWNLVFSELRDAFAFPVILLEDLHPNEFVLVTYESPTHSKTTFYRITDRITDASKKS